MPYLIDTDWAIDFLAGVPEAVALLEPLTADGIAISIITYMELFQGVERAPQPELAQAALATFLGGVPIVPFSLAVARRCARIRERLRRQGRRVNSRALDLIIAATAIEHDLVLVSRNLEDYRHIVDLRIHR